MILLGDSSIELRKLGDNTIDAIVTDPPYGLKFMGKKWDYDVPSIEIWKEVLRVLKPGGYLLSFGGTRTYHRMVINIEDAGFEIRDQIQWLYGSGFPKSHDVSKAIDKLHGAERKVLGLNPSQVGRKTSNIQSFVNTKEFDGAGEVAGQRQSFITAPASDDAKKWAGFGTALKPANEPIVLARKTLEKGFTIAENVLKWGCGGLNIDASRIGTEDKLSIGSGKSLTFKQASSGTNPGSQHTQGRFPANLLLDETAAEMLDEQSGNLHGASRFFYTAKASKSERNAGLPPGVTNSHPTVKPLKLMEYLVRLITPPKGTVLDPFMGSGSTGVAAGNLGFGFVGVELNKEYYDIAEYRIRSSNPSSKVG